MSEAPSSSAPSSAPSSAAKEKDPPSSGEKMSWEQYQEHKRELRMAKPKKEWSAKERRDEQEWI